MVLRRSGCGRAANPPGSDLAGGWLSDLLAAECQCPGLMAPDLDFGREITLPVQTKCYTSLHKPVGVYILVHTYAGCEATVTKIGTLR